MDNEEYRKWKDNMPKKEWEEFNEVYRKCPPVLYYSLPPVERLFWFYQMGKKQNDK